MVDDDSPLSNAQSTLTVETLTALAQMRATALDKAFRIPKFKVTTTENYGRCISPSSALSKFDLSTNDLKSLQIKRELQSNRIETVAHQVIIKNSYTQEILGTIDFPVLDNWVWNLSFPKGDSDFWETGYFMTLLPGTQEGYGYSQLRVIEFFGVRFWPDTLPGGVDRNFDAALGSAFSSSLTPAPDPDVVKPKKDLSASEAESFSRAILAGWPNATETLAHEKAKLFFPDNNVPRDWFLKKFRLIRSHRNRGKQPKTGN